MIRTHGLLIVVALLIACSGGCAMAQGSGWYADISPMGMPPGGSGCIIGAYPSMHDGWDGWGPVSLQGRNSVFVLLYRQNGPGWTGPTGFYSDDPEAPIPYGGSKTWWDMCLWAQGYTVPGNTITVWINNVNRPFNLLGRLVIDYVPESLGWTGPMEYDLDLNQDYMIPLPVATVTDPLQGTRMHITVTYVPEPCSLVALGMGIVGLAAEMRGRRRR